jgi:hypothetical protein
MNTETGRTRRWRWAANLLFGGFMVLGLLQLRQCVIHGRTPVYETTAANEARVKCMTDGTLTVVLLHETGHMMIHELNLPVLGEEEDAADRFAAAALMNRSPDDKPLSLQQSCQGVAPVNAAMQDVALVSAAVFFDAIYQQSLAAHRAPSWGDEHGQPEQRAFTILCLLYGENPQQFAAIVDQVKLPEQRRIGCAAEAANNKTAWEAVLQPALSRQADEPWPTTVGVHYRPVGEDVPEPLRSRLIQGMQRAQASHVLEDVANVMSTVRPPEVIPGLGRLRPPMDMARSLRIGMHGPTEPGDEEYLESQDDYRVIGDACLDGKGGAIENAVWDADTRSITLCYALVDRIESVNKAELAAAGAR